MPPRRASPQYGLRSTKLRKVHEQTKATTKLHAALVKAERAPRHGQSGRLGSGTAGHHRAHRTASEGSWPPKVSVHLRLAVQAPGSETRKMLTDVIGAAAGDGVKIGTILDAYRRLHKLERAPEFEAEATLAWLATQTELEADTLADAAAAAEAMAGGKLDEGNRALRGAREALSKVHTPPPQARAKTNRRAKRVGAQEGDAPRQGNAQSSQSIRPFRTPMPSAAIGPLHPACTLQSALCRRARSMPSSRWRRPTCCSSRHHVRSTTLPPSTLRWATRARRASIAASASASA